MVFNPDKNGSEWCCKIANTHSPSLLKEQCLQLNSGCLVVSTLKFTGSCHGDCAGANDFLDTNRAEDIDNGLDF